MMKGVKVDTGFPISELYVDGGMTVNDLLLQIQANFINEPVGMVILQRYKHVNASILSINKASTLDVFGDINVMKLSLVEIKCSHI